MRASFAREAGKLSVSGRTSRICLRCLLRPLVAKTRTSESANTLLRNVAIQPTILQREDKRSIEARRHRPCASLEDRKSDDRPLEGSERSDSDTHSAERSQVDGMEWERVRGLAERSMFAACTALLYLIGFSFRLEGYMGYLLPLPIILMGVRHGVKSTWNTLALISILQTGKCIQSCTADKDVQSLLGCRVRISLPNTLYFPLMFNLTTQFYLVQ